MKSSLHCWPVGRRAQQNGAQDVDGCWSLLNKMLDRLVENGLLWCSATGRADRDFLGGRTRKYLPRIDSRHAPDIIYSGGTFIFLFLSSLLWLCTLRQSVSVDCLL